MSIIEKHGDGLGASKFDFISKVFRVWTNQWIPFKMKYCVAKLWSLHNCRVGSTDGSRTDLKMYKSNICKLVFAM